MNPELSANTQAILLLTAPLTTSRATTGATPLTLSEYRTLARRLKELGRQPSDFTTTEADDLIDEFRGLFERERLKALVTRGLQLSHAVEQWRSRAIWVCSRADPNYPPRLKQRLRESAPPILYGCGDIGLLNTGGLAVAGSRSVDQNLLDYTESIGELASRARVTIVSGAARGVDQAAMRGTLNAGGLAVGVAADHLDRMALAPENRPPLMDGQLALVSPYDPTIGFHVGNAMARNKIVYALADASLVVNCDAGRGGTWAGAIEQLNKLKFVTVFVRTTGARSEGNEALIAQGARKWPAPSDRDEFIQLLETDRSEPLVEEFQPKLL